MDETELSFIRCPNCRSLVPAVASRCRMCGFVLKDASAVNKPPAESSSPALESKSNAVPKEEIPEERPSRVRQRTISVSGNTNFASAVDAPPEPESIPEPVVEPTPIPTPTPLASAPEPKEFEVDDDSEEFEDDFSDQAEEDSSESLSSSTEVPSTSELIKKKRRRRRRKRKPAQPVAADIPTTPSIVNAQAAPILASVEAANSQPNVVASEEGFVPWRNAPAKSETRPGFKIENRVVSQPMATEAPISEPVVSTPVYTRGNVENERKQEPRHKPVNGSLVGWLVSFMEDSKGTAYELRDGRFFVGREKLRGTDFVIDDSSVSTPQCLVVCDSTTGVTIQDLMSERGTAVVRGSAGLEKNSEQVRLENGDRIRFGEYEMLFVKLPQAR